MKTLQIVCFLGWFCSFTSVSFGQQNFWTWMKGDSTSGSTGVFGIKGTPDSLNTPPALYEPCEWLDHQGKFWLFGGLQGLNEYGALWTYDPSSNMWTWINGSGTINQTGSYGTKGVASPNNHPGSRFCAASWVDTTGNLWMYGGYGRTTTNTVGGLSDLWRYDITTNLWTWISGFKILDVAAVFGTPGIADSANNPGGRLETAATWVDDSNNLWLFGGILCCGASGDMNDVWKYNMSTGEWTWIKGSNTPNQLSVYGTKGIPATDNTPGGRRVYSHWKTADNKFWIFGGQQYSNDCYADLWRFDPVTNDWTWMSGSNIANFAGSYGNECKADSMNEPPARMENRFYATDSCFNFWMFGGISTVVNVYYNDVWYYNSSTNEWKWVSGASTPGQSGFYGTKGDPDVNNHPGARLGGIAWQGPNQTFWLFGGEGLDFGQWNDLWRLQPDPACIDCAPSNPPQSAFLASDSSLCPSNCIDFTDVSLNNPTSWLWLFPGAFPDSSTLQNPVNICYAAPGMYNVTLITVNAAGSDTLVLSNFITVNALPAVPSITVSGSTLISSLANAYQWEFNSVPIPGATSQSFDAVQSGLYTVIIEDSNGCSNSGSIDFVFTGLQSLALAGNVSVYPNPTAGNFTVEFLLNPPMDVVIEICNAAGEVVYREEEEKYTSKTFRKEISTSKLSAGVYLIRLKTSAAIFQQKIIIIKQF